MGVRRSTNRILEGRSPEEKAHLESLGVDDRTIRILIFKNCGGGGGAWTGLICLRIGRGGRRL